jgi:hypothetical protein
MFLRVKFGENSPIIESLNNGILNPEKKQFFITYLSQWFWRKSKAILNLERYSPESRPDKSQ